MMDWELRVWLQGFFTGATFVVLCFLVGLLGSLLLWWMWL